MSFSHGILGWSHVASFDPDFLCVKFLKFAIVIRCLSCLSYRTKWTELALNYPSHKSKPERMAGKLEPGLLLYAVHASSVISVPGLVSKDGDRVHCVVGGGWNKCER